MADPGKTESIESGVATGWLPRWALAWIQPRLSGWGAWTETALFSLLAVLIGRWVSPDDPLFVQAQFPWSWLAPVLVAMRYGVLPGVFGSAILLAGWMSQQPDPLNAEIPKLYFLGGLLLTMVCGEYSGIWRTRLRRMHEVNTYLDDRIERITKRLYLLRLSHDRLEQDLLSRPTTLRDAIADLRRKIAGHTGSGPLPGAQAFLDFLSQHIQIEIAGMYGPIRGADDTLQPLATIGTPPPLRADDPLLAYARSKRTLAHVQTAALDRSLATEHLVVAPIITSTGAIIGYVVISRLPFFSLNEETLQMLGVLVSAYADGIAAADLVVPLLAAFPGGPIDFAEELVKLIRIQRDFGIQSRIVALIIGDHEERLDIYHHVARNRRGPDVVWSIENIAGRSCMITLMPIAGNAAVDGYLLRIRDSVRETFGGDFTSLAIRTLVVAVDDREPLAALKQAIMRKAR